MLTKVDMGVLKCLTRTLFEPTSIVFVPFKTC
jgi:hypothetical protein